jgi:CO/xanthine dehydrogenase FAD-binding subunit
MRAAASLGEALAMLAEEPGVWRPFAGGTDLMVLLEAGALRHERFVSLWGIPELRVIDTREATLTIGALTTYTDLLKHPVVQAEFPMLCEAATQTGGVATQNRGTIGGNIANASPAADTPPALLVYDAELELASVRGTRRVPYHRFHTGYKTMDLAADELITRVLVPRRRGWITTYKKVGTRKAQAIAKICFAAAAEARGGEVQDIRLAYGSVAPTVVRAIRTEQTVRGRRPGEEVVREALDMLSAEIVPIDDVRSTARYRSFVARQLLRAFLESLGSAAAPQPR